MVEVVEELLVGRCWVAALAPWGEASRQFIAQSQHARQVVKDSSHQRAESSRDKSVPHNSAFVGRFSSPLPPHELEKRAAWARLSQNAVPLLKALLQHGHRALACPNPNTLLVFNMKKDELAKYAIDSHLELEEYWLADEMDY